ncbi:MAG: AIDA repeat-containing protein, partial [Lentisphaeria bacterium]|nr:AIDA repeat-containing protein [Lentisphaeria bacterium]
YKLAQGASNFTQTVAIGTETVNYGSITANGADFVYNGVTYSLDQVAGNLTLTIGAAVPTGDQVKVYSSGTLVKQGKVLTGETIVGGTNNSMFVHDGGTANSTTVNSGGSMYIYSGGVANSTTLGSGSVYVRGGVANSITANNGYVGVSSGGVAHSTTLNSKAWMYVTSDSVANDTIVNKTCFIGITSDGVVNGSVIDGTINVYAGGVANDTVMFNSGYMMVASVGVVNDTVLESEGEMRLYGGVANRTIVNSDGYIMVVSGGVANDTVVNSGGSASILSGGKHRVTLTMEAGAVVSAAEGGIIDFTVSERTTGDGYLINDLALIQGAPTYTITVNADQAAGTYKLAQGASNFTQTVAIGTETVNYGSITANGADFVYNGVTYSLDQIAGNLTLTIGAAAPPVPAGDQVKVYSSGTLVKQGTVLTGETIVSGANNSMFVYSGGTANSTFVNSSGLMNVSSGGLAYGTILSGASYFDIGGHAVSTSAPGEMKIHSGGIAENTRIYEGGIMYVFSGGTADETFVGSHGCLKVSSGGIANNVSMGKDWCWVGVSSGLINNVTNVGGSLGIFAGGTITNILLADNGERVYTGLCVYSGGTASNTIVNWQHVSVSSGGTVDTIEVKSGGAIHYSAGAILAGEHVYGGRVAIEGYVDAENADVTFDVSQRLTADSFIVSNLAYLNAGSFSITVAADQEKGTYMLAENADGFAGSLSVGTGTVNWGTVSVNGEQLTYNETVYKLVGESGNLHLVIEAADREAPELTITGNATEWTSRDVVLQVVCDDPEAVVSFRIDNGDWQVCTGTLTVRSNCSIEFRAVDRAGNTTTERVIVDKIDNVAPEAPKVTADITDFTNQSVTLTADYGDAVKKEFSYNNRTWYTYNGGVVLNSNSTVYFRGSDALGNVSGISSYKVDNIDKAAPGVPGEVTIAIDGNNAVADWNDVGDSGVSGVKGYFVRTGNSENMTGHGTFVEASRISLENLAEGAWYCQIASVDKAGNISEWSTVKSFVIGVPGPENLVSTPRGLSWDAVEGASGYVVEYSYDDFESAVAVETVTNALDSFALPGTTFKWRVRALESSVWSFGSEVTGNGSIDAEEIVSDNDGNTDLFFANANDLWGKGYAAENKFTGERIMLAGKNRLDEIFEGSSDANVLVLTDDLNGDALFVDDIYTALGDRARMEEIDEIRAGAGADVIDMTSLRYGYSGKEITIHGGDGDDVIWTGGTDSVLFGDAGDDRLAGSTCFDVFAGGSGNDTMCSGGGNDIFVFSGEFGNDTVEITDYSEVILWFDAGSSEKWDPVRRIYRSGSNSVTVTGSGAVDLKFGDEGGRYAEFAEAGLFDDVSSRKIFEEKDKGMLA